MPKFVSRTEDLVVEELDGGVMVYDTQSHQAHWLDLSATAVWRACEGGAEQAMVARATQLEPVSCELALDRLVGIGLVHTDAAGYSRRTVLRTAAKLGAAGVAAAPIVSAVIPVAAAHASTGSTGGPGGGTGTNSYTLHSGNGAGAGTPDPTNHESTSNPPSGSATNVSPWPGAWIAPLSGTNWISVDAYYGPGTLGPFYYSPATPIAIPAGAHNPQISIEFAADDYVNIYVNGSQINAGNTGHYYSYNTASGALTTGNNTLVFEVYNSGGGPTGLEYLATISWT